MLKKRKLNPSQRLNVYIEAATNVNSEDLAPEDAQRIKQDVTQILEEIQSKNPHALRPFIHDPEKFREAAEEIVGPLEKLTAIMRREFRNRYSPDNPHTEISRVDVPYDALSVLVFSIKIAGPEDCPKFLAALHKSICGSQMKLREVPNRNLPKLWLIMSDSAAFKLAESALALASQLRTDIANQTRIAPAIPAADIAVLMLSAANGAWGKGMSDRITKEVVGPAQINSLNLAKIHLLVHRSMDLLPDTAWAANRLNAKYELLAELRKKGYGLQPAMPTHPIKEERVEQKWLSQLQAAK